MAVVVAVVAGVVEVVGDNAVDYVVCSN